MYFHERMFLSNTQTSPTLSIPLQAPREKGGGKQ